MMSRGLALLLLLAPFGSAQQDAPPLLPSQRIWGTAKHSAFTDLVRWRGHFLCTFREGSGHVPGTNGTVRIIASEDGSSWTSWATIAEKGIDLRDPKLSVMPNGSLLMTCGGSDYSDGLQGWHTRVAFSTDGKSWTPPRRVRGIPADNWFFRLTWHDGVGYCLPNITDADPKTGRARTTNRTVGLFTTTDGLNYTRASKNLALPAGACELTVRFRDDEMWGIVRHAGNRSRSGFIIRARPPYRTFSSAPVRHGMGGPNLLALGDGTWLVGTREYADERPKGRKGTAMVLLRVHADGRFDRLYELPSGGDTSYPGFVVHEDAVWVSYYASHEGKAQIYLARLPLSDILGR